MGIAQDWLALGGYDNGVLANYSDDVSTGILNVEKYSGPFPLFLALFFYMQTICYAQCSTGHIILPKKMQFSNFV